MENSRPPKPLWRTLAILLFALGATLAGALTARTWLDRRAAPPATKTAAVYREPRALPALELVAHDGSRFDASRLQNRWTVLFFGFTNCPDVCPGTLAQLAAVKRRLADLPPAAQPNVVFVSVDPRRDTPAKLAQYVPFFDPSFLGVTGTPQAIETLTKQMGVAVHFGPEVDGVYTVDHTAALFLVGPDAKLAAVFPAPHVPDTIAEDYRTIVAARGDATTGGAR